MSVILLLSASASFGLVLDRPVSPLISSLQVIRRNYFPAYTTRMSDSDAENDFHCRHYIMSSGASLPHDASHIIYMLKYDCRLKWVYAFKIRDRWLPFIYGMSTGMPIDDGLMSGVARKQFSGDSLISLSLK